MSYIVQYSEYTFCLGVSWAGAWWRLGHSGRTLRPLSRSLWSLLGTATLTCSEGQSKVSRNLELIATYHHVMWPTIKSRDLPLILPYMLINLTNYHIMWHDFDEIYHILWHGNHHVAIHVLTCHEACPLPHSLSSLRRCWGRPTRKSVGLAVWSCYWFGDWSADEGAQGCGRWSDRSTQCAGSLPLQKEHKKYINLQQ